MSKTDKNFILMLAIWITSSLASTALAIARHSGVDGLNVLSGLTSLAAIVSMIVLLLHTRGD